MKPSSPDPHQEQAVKALLNAPAYIKAYEDIALLNEPELRPIRLQLELLKAEIAQRDQNILSTIVVFGSARTPDREMAQRELDAATALLAEQPGAEAEAALRRARKRMEHADYYDAARAFARIVSSSCQREGACEYVVVTGGGPGIMEAGNRGAHDVNAKSIGLNIELPFEQAPNPYITPELCFNYRYFAVRKMHFLLRARALLAFPGGYGTLDELFEALTLIQTLKMPRIPVVLYARAFWDRIVNFEALADEGVISPEDLDLFRYAETPEEAWQIVSDLNKGDETETLDTLEP